MEEGAHQSPAVARILAEGEPSMAVRDKGVQGASSGQHIPTPVFIGKRGLGLTKV